MGPFDVLKIIDKCGWRRHGGAIVAGEHQATNSQERTNRYCSDGTLLQMSKSKTSV
jgi:hypothetical protein